MTDLKKLEERKRELEKRNEEINKQFEQVNNWIAQARSEFTTNLGRIDEINKFINAIQSKNKETEDRIKNLKKNK